MLRRLPARHPSSDELELQLVRMERDSGSGEPRIASKMPVFAAVTAYATSGPLAPPLQDAAVLSAWPSVVPPTVAGSGIGSGVSHADAHLAVQSVSMQSVAPSLSLSRLSAQCSMPPHCDVSSLQLGRHTSEPVGNP
ncbi:hypothetical protein D3C83_33960 [compost metagenome]